MDKAINALFEYLRDVIYEPEKASLAVEDLPEQLQEFGQGLQYFAECVMEMTTFALALSKGSLDGKTPPRSNEIAAPLKSLHASLRHLTWQAQRIAQGDYNQRVSFMGDFANAFNTMVEQLAEREKHLEEKIIQIEEKTASLEQGNLLLTTLIHYVPQQIFVVNKHTHNVLLTNDIASSALNANKEYLDNIIRLLSEQDETGTKSEVEITYDENGERHYLVISRFSLEWHNEEAVVYAVNDVSETRRELADLETHVYRDSLTNLYNRSFGMMTLEHWLREKKQFVLIFVDLDSLKYVNDEFGHSEGDIYIIRSADYLRSFCNNAVVCRIGGDEFMVLATDYKFDEAHAMMKDIAIKLRNDEYLHDKEYSYNMSFGISAVDKSNKLTASVILETADQRMYEDKQHNKKIKKQEREAAGLPPLPDRDTTREFVTQENGLNVNLGEAVKTIK